MAYPNGRRRYGDIVPMNDAEIGAAIFAMIVGVSVFAFIVGAHSVARAQHGRSTRAARAKHARKHAGNMSTLVAGLNYSSSQVRSALGYHSRVLSER
jgi:hypothetical protein